MVEVSQSNLNLVNETDPGYGQLFAVLIRRRFWVLGVLCIVMAIAVYQTKKAVPTYKSSMQLQIEPNYQGKEKEGPDRQFADSNIEVDYATQLNIMRSSQLLQKTVDLLSPEYQDIKVDDIKMSLTLTQVLEEDVNTKIVQAEYTDNSPTKTQKVLKAIQKVYQDYNLQQQKLRLTKGLAFIDTQLPAVRDSVAKSEANLEQFRKSQNVIDPQQQAAAAALALDNVEQERRAIRAQYQEAQARYGSLQRQAARSPQQALVASRLSQSTRYQTLLNEIQKTELAIAQLRLRFTDNNPSVQQLIEQRQSQLALLQEEVGRVLGGSAEIGSTGERLLAEGQLGETDVKIAEQLAETQTNLLALANRDRSLAKAEQQLRTELNRFPNLLAEYSRLEPEVQLKRNTLQELLKARQELSLEIARGGFDWQVVEEPQLGVQTGPNTRQNLLLGAVAGLMLGGVAAFMREMIDDSVHTSQELKNQVALPLLGMTPQLSQSKKSEPIISLPFGKPQVLSPWTIQVMNWPPSWESLDLIYQNIQLINSASNLKSLMVTSALAGEGKSTLALGLAISAARLHQRVLLIDADLRRPNLHKQLNLPNEQGLSTLLASDDSVSIHSSIHSSGSYIDILTSGPIPTDPANLLSSQRMQELIATFEQTYDLVLIDAPPVLGMVDAIITASYCSGVVLVGRIGQVTRTELTEATAMLSKLNVIGVVANGGSASTYAYTANTKHNKAVLNHSLGK